MRKEGVVVVSSGQSWKSLHGTEGVGLAGTVYYPGSVGFRHLVHLFVFFSLHPTLSSCRVSPLHAIFLLILLLLNLILTPLCQWRISLETIGSGSFPEAQAENILSMFSSHLAPHVRPGIRNSPE